MIEPHQEPQRTSAISNTWPPLAPQQRTLIERIAETRNDVRDLLDIDRLLQPAFHEGDARLCTLTRSAVSDERATDRGIGAGRQEHSLASTGAHRPPIDPDLRHPIGKCGALILAHAPDRRTCRAA